MYFRRVRGLKKFKSVFFSSLRARMFFYEFGLTLRGLRLPEVLGVLGTFPLGSESVICNSASKYFLGRARTFLCFFPLLDYFLGGQAFLWFILLERSVALTDAGVSAWSLEAEWLLNHSTWGPYDAILTRDFSFLVFALSRVFFFFKFLFLNCGLILLCTIKLFVNLIRCQLIINFVGSQGAIFLKSKLP